MLTICKYLFIDKATKLKILNVGPDSWWWLLWFDHSQELLIAELPVSIIVGEAEHLLNVLLRYRNWQAAHQV